MNEFFNNGYVRVGNKRKGALKKFKPQKREWVIYVDRSNPILGNRHVLTNVMDDEMRRVVVEKYRVDLENDWSKKGLMYKEICRLAEYVHEGYNIILMCWCAPKLCHASLIEEKINKILNDYE